MKPKLNNEDFDGNVQKQTWVSQQIICVHNDGSLPQSFGHIFMKENHVFVIDLMWSEAIES